MTTDTETQADARINICIDPTTTCIRDLNDNFRRRIGIGSKVVTTRGVSERGADFTLRAINTVVKYAVFSEDNDPYCEHDFGSFELDGEKLFWKIDAYDQKLEWGSPDPSNPDVTKRVLTIMLADEY